MKVASSLCNFKLEEYWFHSNYMVIIATWDISWICTITTNSPGALSLNLLILASNLSVYDAHLANLMQCYPVVMSSRKLELHKSNFSGHKIFISFDLFVSNDFSTITQLCRRRGELHFLLFLYCFIICNFILIRIRTCATIIIACF